MSTQNGNGARSELVSLRLTPEQVRLIEDRAASEGVSMSVLIRTAIGMYVFDGVIPGEDRAARRSYRRRQSRSAPAPTSYFRRLLSKVGAR